MLNFLREENLVSLDIGRIAWRMKDAAFFKQAIAVLRERRIFSSTLWQYAVLHNDVAAIREYLAPFSEQFGPELECALLATPVRSYTVSDSKEMKGEK